MCEMNKKQGEVKSVMVLSPDEFPDDNTAFPLEVKNRCGLWGNIKYLLCGVWKE